MDLMAIPQSKPEVASPAASLWSRHLKWSWSCRTLDPEKPYQLSQDGAKPQVGDIAALQVEAIGYHGRIMTANQGEQRLYPGDTLVGVFGNRYATSAFEGEVGTTDDLHILTAAGLIGTVRSRHGDMKPPTRLSFVGYLTDDSGKRLNLKELRFRPAFPNVRLPDIVLLIGTAMDSGKTSTAAKLVRMLVRRDLRIAVCKLTGSVSHRDIQEYRATAAHDVLDFSDYGFSSTYLCPKQELISLFYTMLADASRVDPDLVIMEIADGVLQRETKMLLEDTAIRGHVRGVVLTAACAASALYGLAQLETRGYRVMAVSGLITSSPLFVRELTENSSVPVCLSTGAADELAELVLEHLRTT